MADKQTIGLGSSVPCEDERVKTEELTHGTGTGGNWIRTTGRRRADQENMVVAVINVDSRSVTKNKIRDGGANWAGGRSTSIPLSYDENDGVAADIRLRRPRYGFPPTPQDNA